MLGYATLFNYHYDTPLWAMSISMVIIGMGLGQLMQTLTLAAQNAVEPRDIGVATSSTMFFRQMGGTLGVAVFISLLFNNLPDRIADAFKSTAYGNPFKAKVGEIMAQFSEGKLPATDPNAVFIQSLQADPAAIGDKLNGDSSFLSTIDPVLARPFLVGFADSSIAVFVIAAAVVAVAFVLSFFLKAAPLREKSAAEENADAAVAAAAH